MYNSTTAANDTDENLIEQQIAGFVSAAVLLAISVYLFIVMALYTRNVRRNGHKTPSAHNTSKITEGGAIFHYLLLSGLGLVVIRQVLEFAELSVAFHSDLGCNNLRLSKNTIFAIIIALPYIVLWCRQRQCYKSPILHTHSSYALRFYSKTIIIEMILGDLTALALFLFTREYVSSYRGCVLHRSVAWSKAPAVILLVCTVSFQVALLGMFLYPIYKVKQSSEMHGLPDVSNLSAMMKRVAILTAVIIFVDANCAAISWRLDDNVHTNIRQQIYDVSLISCYICVIAGFKDWKLRLLPFLSGSRTTSHPKPLEPFSVSTGTTHTTINLVVAPRSER